MPCSHVLSSRTHVFPPSLLTSPLASPSWLWHPFSSVSCAPTQSGSTVSKYAVCCKWACSPPLTWHPALCSTFPPLFTNPAGSHGKMLPLLISWSKTLASSGPLVASHPCQTTLPFKSHIVKQNGCLRIVLSDQVGSNGSFCCTC